MITGSLEPLVFISTLLIIDSSWWLSEKAQMCVWWTFLQEVGKEYNYAVVI